MLVTVINYEHIKFVSPFHLSHQKINLLRSSYKSDFKHLEFTNLLN